MKTLFVLDKNCRVGHEERTHEIVLDNGGTLAYHFKMNKPLEMPEAHAKKFLRDPAWIVTDKDGIRITPIVDIKAGREIPKLAADQVVAKWEELTVHALLNRAQMRHGGEKFTANTKKKALVAFLRKPPVVQTKTDEAIGEDEGGHAGDVAGEIGASALDGMLGADAQVGAGAG